MRRRIKAEFALFRLQPRLPAADLGVAGELAGEQEMRIVELELNGGLVDLARSGPACRSPKAPAPAI